MSADVVGGLCLDFDGTIIDSEESAFDAWRQTYEKHGCRLELTEWLPCVGRGGTPWAERLGKLSGVDKRELQRERDEAKHRHAERLPCRPGIQDLLRAARDLRVPTAIVSNAERAWVERHLDRLDLNDQIDVVVAREDFSHPKPAPQSYLVASRKLGVPPERCLAVEDSPVGARAVSAARIRLLYVPNRITLHLEADPAWPRTDVAKMCPYSLLGACPAGSSSQDDCQFPCARKVQR